jgi:hypothetical protein
MRKIGLTVMTVTTLLFSCTKEEIKTKDKEVTNANLKIQFTNPRADTKAHDGTGTKQEATIKNAMVFILGTTKDILSRHYFNDTEIKQPEQKALPTTTSAQYVWIFCNLGDSSEYVTTFGSCRTLTQLQGVSGKVENINNGFGADKYGIWMVGTHAGTLTFQNTNGRLEAQAKVDMKLIPTRIDVTVNNKMSNYKENPAKGANGHEDYPRSLQLRDVSIMYSAAENRLFPLIGTDTVFIPAHHTNMYYAAGLDPTIKSYNLLSTNMKGIPAGNNKSSNLFADWDAFKAGSTFQKTFYALPTDTTAARANTEEITLLIRADRSISKNNNAVLDSIESHYFPVIFNPTDVVGQRMGNGEYYTIVVELKGDAETSAGGTPNPNQPVLNAFVTVKVSAGKWNTITTVNKTFQ